MAKLDIQQFPCLTDNFGVLVHDSEAGVTASIDAPDAKAVKIALAEKGWNLTHILVTHHHADHTGGIAELKHETGALVIGPKAEAARIPGLDRAVGEGDTFALGTTQVHVLDTPGHTAGHICYWLPSAGVVFVGDTLFAMGCGRILEGTAELMWSSLKKLMALPPATRIYCGHEYTLANGKFALGIEPDNAKLAERVKMVETLRAAGQPTLPTRLDIELETNPFLRAGDFSIKKRLGLLGEPDWKSFAEVRARKNKA